MSNFAEQRKTFVRQFSALTREAGRELLRRNLGNAGYPEIETYCPESWNAWLSRSAAFARRPWLQFVEWEHTRTGQWGRA